MTWGETLDTQKSSLRWDIKRTIKILCKQLSDIGEECFLVTCNVNNGWISHLGSVYGDDFINDHTYIPYRFLDYCRESMEVANLSNTQPKQAEGGNSVPLTNPLDTDDGKQIRIEMLPTVSDDEEVYQMVPIKPEDIKAEPVDLEAIEGVTGTKQHGDKLQKQHKKTSPKQGINKSPKPHKKGLLGQSVNESPKKRVGIKLPFSIRSPVKKYKLDRIGDRRSGVRRSSITSTLKSHNKRKQTTILTGRTVHSCELCNQTFKHDNNYVMHILGERHQTNLHRNIVCYKCNTEYDSYQDLFHHVTGCKSKKPV